MNKVILKSIHTLGRFGLSAFFLFDDQSLVMRLEGLISITLIFSFLHKFSIRSRQNIIIASSQKKHNCKVKHIVFKLTYFPKIDLALKLKNYVNFTQF